VLDGMNTVTYSGPGQVSRMPIYQAPVGCRGARPVACEPHRSSLSLPDLRQGVPRTMRFAPLTTSYEAGENTEPYWGNGVLSTPFPNYGDVPRHVQALPREVPNVGAPLAAPSSGRASPAPTTRRIFIDRARCAYVAVLAPSCTTAGRDGENRARAPITE
jgi:hypothetical protein